MDIPTLNIREIFRGKNRPVNVIVLGFTLIVFAIAISVPPLSLNERIGDMYGFFVTGLILPGMWFMIWGVQSYLTSK